PLWADHQGVIALDARLRVRREPCAGAERFAILPYPAGLAETVAWRGRTLLLRPIRPEDEAQHLAFIGQLAPEDIRLRFFNTRRVVADVLRENQAMRERARRHGFHAEAPEGEALHYVLPLTAPG